MNVKPKDALTTDALAEFVTRRYQQRVGNRSIDGDTTKAFKAKITAINELEKTIKKAVYSSPT